jgi:thiol peroxidase
MNDKQNKITIKGKPLTLIGDKINVGDTAPDVELTDHNLSPVKISSFKDKICIISTVPSLDTPVCDMQTRWFNQEADKLGPDIAILVVSMDLPFAQKRWCGAAGVDKVKTLSDYKDAAFGKSYGVLIKEMHLLARALFVVDQKGLVQYIQIVKELSNEPNYDQVLKAVSGLI